MRLTRSSSWRRLRWWEKAIGRWIIPTAAERQRPRINLNRYPHEIIGVAVYFGGRRYLSWVWPVWIVDVPLTSEQLHRDLAQFVPSETEHNDGR